MRRRITFFLYALFCFCIAQAANQGGAITEFQLGDCVVFREGGFGKVFKTPTYWLKGKVADISREQRLAGRCPLAGKALQSYSHEDWERFAESFPCVDGDEEAREVIVQRVRLVVDSWETPWSKQHGTVGLLFRGQFLDTVLRKGELIDVNALWLERCDLPPGA